MFLCIISDLLAICWVLYIMEYYYIDTYTIIILTVCIFHIIAVIIEADDTYEQDHVMTISI